MEKPTDPKTMASLGKALGGLGGKLPQAKARAGAQLIVTAMEKETDPNHSSSLGDALGTLSLRMDDEAIASLLKSLVVVGETRDKVLVKLQKKADQKFDGDLWKSVKWLQDEGIDVKNISHFPVTSKPGE